MYIFTNDLTPFHWAYVQSPWYRQIPSESEAARSDNYHSNFLHWECQHHQTASQHPIAAQINSSSKYFSFIYILDDYLTAVWPLFFKVPFSILLLLFNSLCSSVLAKTLILTYTNHNEVMFEVFIIFLPYHIETLIMGLFVGQ